MHFAFIFGSPEVAKLVSKAYLELMLDNIENGIKRPVKTVPRLRLKQPRF
jgi:hypothetical protein